jgi:hypothetical protein
MNTRMPWFCCLALLMTPFAFRADAHSQQGQAGNSTLTFDPAHQRPISFSGAQVTARLIVGKHNDSLEITRQATRKTATITLPEELVQVDGISGGLSDKLVVWGMVNGSAAEVVIISLQSNAIIDRFTCYVPAVSPNGEYVAFIKFYPMHFSEGIEDHYMLYDLKEDPAQNRPKGISTENWQIVGNAVYPPGIGNEEYDNINRPPSGACLSKSGLYWTEDSRYLLFANSFQSVGEIDIVLVEIQEGGKTLAKTVHQASADVCRTITDIDGDCRLLVRKIDSFTTAPMHIVVVYQVAGTNQEKAMTYYFSQFK